MAHAFPMRAFHNAVAFNIPPLFNLVITLSVQFPMSFVDVTFSYLQDVSSPAKMKILKEKELCLTFSGIFPSLGKTSPSINTPRSG